SGRTDFQKIELVRNGQVIATAPSVADGRHFAAEMELAVEIDAPSWLAVRTPPPPAVERDAAPEVFPANEFGGKLFSHTSPVYVQFHGQGVFDAQVARGLLAEMQDDWQQIEKQAVFANDAQRQQVRAVYDEAIAKLRERVDGSDQ
ncbi:MAG: hypothetical protein WD845_03105, partial [Pirellulales bacterium]